MSSTSRKQIFSVLSGLSSLALMVVVFGGGLRFDGRVQHWMSMVFGMNQVRNVFIVVALSVALAVAASCLEKNETWKRLWWIVAIGEVIGSLMILTASL